MDCSGGCTIASSAGCKSVITVSGFLRSELLFVERIGADEVEPRRAMEIGGGGTAGACSCGGLGGRVDGCEGGGGGGASCEGGSGGSGGGIGASDRASDVVRDCAAESSSEGSSRDGGVPDWRRGGGVPDIRRSLLVEIAGSSARSERFKGYLAGSVRSCCRG